MSVCPRPGPTADPAASPAGNKLVWPSAQGSPAGRAARPHRRPGLRPTPSSPWSRDSLNFSPLGTDIRRKGLQRCLPGRGSLHPWQCAPPPTPSKNVYCPFYNHQMEAPGLQASSPSVTSRKQSPGPRPHPHSRDGGPAGQPAASSPWHGSGGASSISEPLTLRTRNLQPKRSGPSRQLSGHQGWWAALRGNSPGSPTPHSGAVSASPGRGPQRRGHAGRPTLTISTP